MAKGFKTGGRNFVKGQVSNPKGRPRTPDDLKMARQMYAHDIEAAIYKYGDMTIEQLKAAVSNPSTPSKDLAIIKIMTEAISKGDHQRLDFILNRTIGKVKDTVDHNVQMKPSILVKTDGTEVHFIKKPINEEK